MKKLSLSIVIATYNSSKTLQKTLQSIKKQSYPQNRIEIIIIDGGSRDNTIDIAKSFNCKILINKKRLPAWGKHMGFIHAKNNHVMVLDSDEVIVNQDSIEKKMKAFQYKNVYAVTSSGYKNPPGYSFMNQYVNDFGDPFSYFYYRSSSDYRFFVPLMKKRYKVIEETKNILLLDFSESKTLPIFELEAMASIIDRNYIKTNFPNEINNPGILVHMFYLLVSSGAYLAVSKDDPLLHFSVNDIETYLRKIKFRVINNIYTPATDGFIGRTKLSNNHPFKKYLFILYTISVVLPLADSIHLVFTRKNLVYLLHTPLCIYTLYLIVLFMLLKKFRFIPKIKGYGEK